jgi:hypothetical protein
MEWLSSWEVTSFVVGALVGCAFAVLGMDDFRLARLFFLLAAADAAGGIVMWGIKANLPEWQRSLLVFLLCGAVGVLCVQAFRYVGARRKAKEGRKDQRSSATLPPQNAPQLEFEFSNTFWGERDHRLMFIVAGAIFNRHGPDTGLTNWQMNLASLPGLHATIQGSILRRSIENITPHGANVTFVPSDYFPEKTVEPIRTGGGVSGWIWCDFPITLQDFRKLGSATLTVSFVDVLTGKTHSANQQIADTTKGLDVTFKPTK